MSCTLQDAGEFVQALVGPAPTHTVLDCYRELLALCAEHRIQRVLLVSQDMDETTDSAMAEAIEGMGAGLGPHFKLAMVAHSPRTFALHRSAERLAARNGIAARAFETRGEAVQWLTGRPQGSREMR